MNSHSFSSEILGKALKYDRPFKLIELGAEIDELEEILDDSGLFFCNFDNCGTREYLSKKFFFQGSNFTVHFTSYEERHRLLCAPLRFLPFSSEIPEMKIAGRPVPLIKKKLPLTCLENVYSLDHGQELVKHINSSTSNTVFSLKAVSGIELPVYDFAEFSLKAGDHLRFTLHSSCLEGEILRSEDINFKEAQQWCEKFERSLLGVLREFGPFSDVYSQLEMAYFYGDQSIRNSSALAIRDFLQLSKKVQLADFVFQKIIWFSESDPLSSPEVDKKISLIQDNFSEKPFVNKEFYFLLGKDLAGSFVSSSDSLHLDTEPECDRKLKRTVRRAALWIKNNKQVIIDPEMPKNEILMFDAALSELQYLCAYFFSNKTDDDSAKHFQSALEINFEILSELMSFLQEYYLSL